MEKTDQYKRLYCENCRLIWGKQAIGIISCCSDCKQKLVLKSFNPWINTWGGLGAIGLGCLTLLITTFPLIWIGGFIWGISLIGNAFKQWDKIQELDDSSQKKSGRSTKNQKQNRKQGGLLSLGDWSKL